MRKLVRLQKDLDVSYNSFITEFLDPEYVYIPVKSNYTKLVKIGDRVLMGQIILENNLNKITSPISGVVVGVDKKNVDGYMSPVIVIQNDYKETEKKKNKAKTKYTKDNIINTLYDFYFKYVASVLESKNIKTLVISSIEDEPYVMTSPFVLKKYTKEILEMADILSKTFDIKKTIVTIESSHTKVIETFLSKKGTYPNISMELIEGKYLLGKEFFLLEHLGINESNTLCLDVKSVYKMYNSIKNNRYNHETFLTVAGPSLQKSQVIKVKEGTSLEELINRKIKIKNNDSIFVLNGLMMGSECKKENTIISPGTNGIIVIPNKEEKTYQCINCGLCYKLCPVKVNPKKVMDKKRLSRNCIDCGLCSYLCPSNINLRKFLRGEYE